jgi:predicted adenine nucleotide alpha hydrolase (AANH) superfamily ATPase
MNKKEPVLLHICCAPCLIYPLKKLRELNFEVGGFFYNPNIYPSQEYLLREKTVSEYANRAECSVYFAEGSADGLFPEAQAAAMNKADRCKKCWYLRMRKTAEHARSIGVTTFTTTLLVSPYQDQEMLKQAGEKAAAEYGITFYYYNFSEGYQEAVRVSKQEALYRQKYCGCRFSLQERREMAAR